MTFWVKFWIDFDSFLNTFWCFLVQSGFVKINTRLERNARFRGSGGSRDPTFSCFFSALILDMIFKRFLSIFGLPGTSLGVPWASLGRSWGARFGEN